MRAETAASDIGKRRPHTYHLHPLQLYTETRVSTPMLCDKGSQPQKLVLNKVRRAFHNTWSLTATLEEFLLRKLVCWGQLKPVAVKGKSSLQKLHISVTPC